MSKTIKIKHDREVLVDDEDYECLLQYKWRAVFIGQAVYAKGGADSDTFMHRLITKTENSNTIIDHRNRDGLDNRKENLRISDKSTNGMNREKQKNNKSGYKGVSWCKTNKKWTARIKSKKLNKYLFLGYFVNKEDAAIAYNEAAKIYHAEFAFLNKIEV